MSPAPAGVIPLSGNDKSENKEYVNIVEYQKVNSLKVKKFEKSSILKYIALKGLH